MGDLNTDALGGEAGTAPDVFRGRIHRAEGSSASSPSPAPPDEVLEVDTKFDPSCGTFSWGGVDLSDAFSDVHRWGLDDDTAGSGGGAGRPCTSKNADRTEWIDYMFRSSGLALAGARSRCEAPRGPIPDEDHPSDHLPLWATFEFA